MKRRIVWLVVSSLMVLSLLAASCAPAVEEAAPAEEKPAAPAEAVAPVVAEKPAAQTGQEMVKVSLKKLDGTVVEKLVEKPRYGGELIITNIGDIQGFDVGYIQPGPADRVIFATHEKLLQGDWTRGLDGTGEVTWRLTGWNAPDHQVASLAESWEIAQPDTIIYHIRRGVHWGINPALEPSRLVGGREMTADDIAWNLRRVYFELKTGGHYTGAGMSRPVDAYATDKWTVVVKAPEGQIWQTFEFVGPYGVQMYAPEVGKKYGDFRDWTRAVGTGPFIITDYVAMSQATWVRNPNYWMKDPLFPENQLPYIDSLKVLIIPDPSTRMSALRTGRVDVDYSRTILWEDAASLKKTNPQLKYASDLTRSASLAGREDKPELPFKDIRVRRALMMAINFQEIVDTYYGGNAIMFGFPVVPIKELEKAYTPLEELGLAADGFDTKKAWGYHPAEAKKLLAEAGYPNGFKTEVVTVSKDVDQLSIIKEYWAKNLNVDLALDVKEVTVHSTMRARRSYKEMYMFAGTVITNAHQHLEYRSGATLNTAMVDDPKIEENYNRLAALEPYSDEWFKVLKDNNLYVNHRVDYYAFPLPYIWIFWQPWLKRYTGEVAVGGLGAVFTKYVWIDQELKKAMGR